MTIVASTEHFRLSTIAKIFQDDGDGDHGIKHLPVSEGLMLDVKYDGEHYYAIGEFKPNIKSNVVTFETFGEEFFGFIESDYLDELKFISKYAFQVLHKEMDKKLKEIYG